MTKKQKRNLKRIIISFILFLIVFSTDLILKHAFSYDDGLASLIPTVGWILPFILYFCIYIYIGHDVLKKAFLNLIHGQMLDENFLMCIATIGAFSLGIYRSLTNKEIEGFDEGCAVLLFYQLGEWFQSYAVSKSRKSISSLMDIRPDYANLVLEDGSDTIIDPSEAKVDDIIRIKPGEKIPLDGVIVKGNSSLDTKALTGESLPREVGVNDNVISGTINLSSVIEVKVSKCFYDSTVSKILELVENASNKKSKSEEFISKFAKVYTPTVVSLAVIIGVIIGFVTKSWDIGLYRGLTFLVVSCPCALVISIPLSFFAGIGGASKKGILVKGSIYLENFNKVKTFIFDKTGTLTKGNFVVTKVYPEEKKDEILALASKAELNSNHPIALSIKQAYKKEIDALNYELVDIPGKGIKAINKDNNETILCGNNKLMEENNITYNVSNDIGTIIYVSKNNVFIGYIVISDEIKEDAKETISYLNSKHLKTIMLTGDNDSIASSVSSKLGLSEYHSNLLPQDKVEILNSYLNKKKKDELVCFVGDGINDAPSLISSDIGISMGGVGQDAAIEASDIVLMHDNLSSLIETKKISKMNMKIVYENIIFALGVKVLIMALSAFGLLGNFAMWLAVFGDVGVALIAIINALRMLFTTNS